jgi:hypothetical protein
LFFILCNYYSELECKVEEKREILFETINRVYL